MISTKGYFYFEHINPEHNISTKTKKQSKTNITNLNI